MTNSPPVVRRTQPARYYTDPDWFAAEMTQIFAPMWINVGRFEDVSTRGAFIRRDIADASVLIVGIDNGDVRAFLNLCRHRGTRLCVNDAGTFAGSIQCPYHAWTYDLEGALIAAPQMDEADGFVRTDFALHRVGCEVWDGHVFMQLSSERSPLARQLGELPSRFAPWRMGDLRRAHRAEYDVGANWKLIVQNYNECLHCPIIHPLLNRMHHYLGAANVPSTDTYCGGAMGLRDGVDTLSDDGRRRRALLPGLGADDQRTVHYFAVYPNLLLTLHPDYMLTTTIWPQSADRTRLVSEWHFHPDEIARPDFVFEDAVRFWDLTNREDWAISERSQQGITSRGYSPGPYSARETQLWEFDQFVLSRVTSVSRT